MKVGDQVRIKEDPLYEYSGMEGMIVAKVYNRYYNGKKRKRDPDYIIQFPITWNYFKRKELEEV